MLITTAIPALAGLLTTISTADAAPAEDDEALCSGCWAPAPGGPDTARDNHDWDLDPDTGDLLCGSCATDGPTGPYDPAYYG
ncbi:hypothetical protein [Streptomyces sp. NBRC 109706]|uniref:hypothetical protein n=1 Tax=Streptomyces sp. NBRC 109706 TaxID=1550035 RepID=UPI000780940E|nr:hypothetical protein [Streptomyces sp. NBRC 109706]